MVKKNILTIALIILLLLMIVGVVFYFTTKNIKEYNNKIKEQTEKLAKLDKVIKEQQNIHSLEQANRKGIHEKDSIEVIKLKRLKRKDSLTHITTIKKLISKYTNNTLIELEKAVVTSYNKSTKDSLPQISFSESNLLDTTIQKVEKQWSLATYDQNKELKSVIVIKDSINTTSTNIIHLRDETISSYERDTKAFNTQVKALEGKNSVKDSIISEQKHIIKNTKTQRNVGIGVLAILLIGSLFLK